MAEEKYGKNWLNETQDEKVEPLDEALRSLLKQETDPEILLDVEIFLLYMDLEHKDKTREEKESTKEALRESIGAKRAVLQLKSKLLLWVIFKIT